MVTDFVGRRLQAEWCRIWQLLDRLAGLLCSEVDCICNALDVVLIRLYRKETRLSRFDLKVCRVFGDQKGAYGFCEIFILVRRWEGQAGGLVIDLKTDDFWLRTLRLLAKFLILLIGKINLILAYFFDIFIHKHR